MMSELRTAKRSMNASVREALEARPAFDPSSLDVLPASAMHAAPATELLESDLLAPDDGRAGVTYGGLGPWMPWEVIP